MAHPLRRRLQLSPALATPVAVAPVEDPNPDSAMRDVLVAYLAGLVIFGVMLF